MSRASTATRWHALRRSRLTLLAAAVALVTLGVGLVREIVNRYEITSEIERLERQIDELEARRAELTKLIDYFGSPLFQEQEAREKLGLAKPGESVIIVPLEESTGAAGDDRPSDEAGSNPAKWWQYFFSS